MLLVAILIHPQKMLVSFFSPACQLYTSSLGPENPYTPSPSLPPTTPPHTHTPGGGLQVRWLLLKS